MSSNYFPNMVEGDDVRKSGLICWRDKERACGPDCMAFTTPPDGPDYQGQQWASCMLLVNSHRTGKHLTIIAQGVGELVKLRKNEKADAVRSNQPAPPGVR